MLIAYYRVSTQRQGASGLGLDAQEAAAKADARRRKDRIVASYTETESGRNCRRPELAAALAAAKAKGATLVVAKVDRLARDARFLLALVDGAVPIRFLDLPDVDATTPAGRLQLSILAVFAEFESRRIGQRIREAYAAKIARGEPPTLPADNPRWRKAWRLHCRERRRLSREYLARTVPLIRPLRDRGLTYWQVAAALNAKGVATRNGKPWRGPNVWRVLAEAGRARLT